MKDSLTIVAVTLIITVIMMLIYHTAVDTPAEDRAWFSLIWQTTLNSILLAICFEYLGVNNMIAESSIRYSRGTTLAKYASRREAMLYQCLYKLLQSPKYNTDADAAATMKHNFEILKAIVNRPNLRGKIADAAGNSAYIDKLKLKHPKDAAAIDLMAGLPAETVAALDTIGDRMSENIAYDIIAYGFSGYKHGDGGLRGLIETTIDADTLARANERGGAIAQELAEPEDVGE